MCRPNNQGGILSIKHQNYIQNIFSILDDIGRKASFDNAIIDFGCGSGQTVKLLLQKGYRNTVGFDIDPERIEIAKKSVAPEHQSCFHTINKSPYHLPIQDDSVDFLFSSQVLEHVEVLDEVFSELSRIMKSDAISVHIFPPKFRLLETHTHVPFGNTFRSTGWHRLWVLLGFRQALTEHLSSTQCAQAHLTYLRKRTFYRTEKEIIAIANRHGLKAYFLNGLKYSNKLRALQPMAPFKLTKFFYSSFISKLLVLEPDNNKQNSSLHADYGS